MKSNFAIRSLSLCSSAETVVRSVLFFHSECFSELKDAEY